MGYGYPQRYGDGYKKPTSAARTVKSQASTSHFPHPGGARGGAVTRRQTWRRLGRKKGHFSEASG